MPSVVEEEVKVISAKGKVIPPQLLPFIFKPGHSARGPGRPKGSRSFATILSKVEEPIARSYVRQALNGNPPILTDARKVLLPIDSDAPHSSTLNLLVWLREHPTVRITDRQSPTLLMGSSDAEQPLLNATSPTLSPSAGTENSPI